MDRGSPDSDRREVSACRADQADPGDHSRRRHAFRRGLRAECLAGWVLRSCGYRVLAHRFKTGCGEVDLIARRRNTLAFVEVKARLADRSADEVLSDRSVARIRAAAELFIGRNPALAGCECRFDLFLFRGMRFRWLKHFF